MVHMQIAMLTDVLYYMLHTQLQWIYTKCNGCNTPCADSNWNSQLITYWNCQTKMHNCHKLVLHCTKFKIHLVNSSANKTAYTNKPVHHNQINYVCEFTEMLNIWFDAVITRNPKVIWEEPRHHPSWYRITTPQKSNWLQWDAQHLSPKLPLPFDDLHPI